MRTLEGAKGLVLTTALFTHCKRKHLPSDKDGVDIEFVMRMLSKIFKDKLEIIPFAIMEYKYETIKLRREHEIDPFCNAIVNPLMTITRYGYGKVDTMILVILSILCTLKVSEYIPPRILRLESKWLNVARVILSSKTLAICTPLVTALVIFWGNRLLWTSARFTIGGRVKEDAGTRRTFPFSLAGSRATIWARGLVILETVFTIKRAVAIIARLPLFAIFGLFPIVIVILTRLETESTVRLHLISSLTLVCIRIENITATTLLASIIHKLVELCHCSVVAIVQAEIKHKVVINIVRERVQWERTVRQFHTLIDLVDTNTALLPSQLSKRLCKLVHILEISITGSRDT